MNPATASENSRQPLKRGNDNDTSIMNLHCPGFF